MDTTLFVYQNDRKIQNNFDVLFKNVHSLCVGVIRLIVISSPSVDRPKNAEKIDFLTIGRRGPSAFRSPRNSKEGSGIPFPLRRLFSPIIG